MHKENLMQKLNQLAGELERSNACREAGEVRELIRGLSQDAINERTKKLLVKVKDYCGTPRGILILEGEH